MGYALKPIPFWTGSIEVSEVVETSFLDDFNIETLDDLGQDRLNQACLYERDDCDLLILVMHGGDFITFHQAGHTDEAQSS